MIPTLLIGLLLSMLPADTPASGQSQSQNQNLAQTRSPHGDLNIPCQNCHTAIGWKPIRAVPEFDHNKTKYPLRGLHENVACTQCHTKPVFSNVGSGCADCHADIHKRQMGANCEQCHTVKGWNVSIQSIQNHQNRFPLIGAHAALECDACHKGAAVGQFQGLSTQCYSCHAQSFQKTSNPNHVASRFSTTCEQCHGMDTWLNAKFDHSTSGFPLTGAHATVACEQCHKNNNFNLTSADTACVSCHLKDFQGTTNPNHVSGGFSQMCQQCHNTVSWAGASFDHSTTGFPLTGAHATVQCTQCHVNNNYNLTNTTCVSCHLKDFQGASNPNHVSGGFSQTCETCHNTAAWQPAQFDHSKSGFPLTGAHATVQCTQCHVNNNYNITDTTCVSCHQTDYNNAVAPVNHVQAGLPTTCQQCHDTVLWTDGKFDHSTTGFQLTGAHMTPPRQCADCHNARFGNYNITTAACVSCHQADFTGAVAPVNHVQAGFPANCEQCHDTVLWTNGKFDHSTTGFQLTGAHMTPPRQCADCHNAQFGNYNITTGACVSCHQADFTNAVTPVNHIQANFPTNCEQCHDTVLWTNGKFNHAATGFALSGAHSSPPRQCTDCHNAKFGNYNITTGACISCHQADFTGAVTPVNHVGFPVTCEVCHDTVLWTNATFNHASTPFGALTGMHATTACANCHVNNNYTTVPMDCYSCHKAVYAATTNPNHVAAGFPQTCGTCHTTSAWTGAAFNHTFFPLNHGGANGVCAVCHTNSANYAVFQCTGCHGNNNAANFRHPNVGGYVYNSVNCYGCHKN